MTVGKLHGRIERLQDSQDDLLAFKLPSVAVGLPGNHEQHGQHFARYCSARGGDLASWEARLTRLPLDLP